jgi:hypothetical protein
MYLYSLCCVLCVRNASVAILNSMGNRIGSQWRDFSTSEMGFFFIILFCWGCSSYGFLPRMTLITIYTGFWIHFPLGGRDSRFDRIIKVHNALKTFLDLWNVGSGGDQWPKSEVHKEISAVRLRAYIGQSNIKCWADSDGNEHLHDGKVTFLRKYWWAFKRLWPVRICMTWCERLLILSWIKQSGEEKNERVVTPWRESLHSLLHAFSSVLLIVYFMCDGSLLLGGSEEASLTMTAWVWVAMDCRALGENNCRLDSRCCLRMISVTLNPSGMVPARTESTPVSAVWNDLEVRTLNCRSINRNFFWPCLVLITDAQTEQQ